MAGFRVEEWIAGSSEQVFELLSDAGNAPKLVPGVTQVEKLTDGPIGVGTRYRETRLMGGNTHQTELEVVRYEPPTVYAVRNVTKGVETVYNYRLTPERNGTRINLEATVSGSGFRALVAPLLAFILRREDGDHLARLKVVAEGEGENI